jgi:hypothetical protein
MAYKIDYEFKTDKAGRKYALKVNLNTGIIERLKYDLATQRQKKNLQKSVKRPEKHHTKKVLCGGL